MSNYKVVLRIDSSSEESNKRSTWEPGCPLLIEAMQIARNTDTGEAFLQAKVQNISSSTIGSFKACFTCQFEDGTSEDLTSEPLDADIPPAGHYVLTPQKLSRGDVKSVSGFVESVSKFVESVADQSGKWESSDGAQELPQPNFLSMSSEAFEERRLQLGEKGCKKTAAAKLHLQEAHDGWIMCPCGQVNVNTEKCVSCGLTFDDVFASEEEEYFLDSAKERAERKKKMEAEKEEKKQLYISRLKKASIIAAPIVLFVIILAAVLAGTTIPVPSEADDLKPYVNLLGSKVTIDDDGDLHADIGDDLRSNQGDVMVMDTEGEVSFRGFAESGITIVQWESNENFYSSQMEDLMEAFTDCYGEPYYSVERYNEIHCKWIDESHHVRVEAEWGISYGRWFDSYDLTLTWESLE